MNMSERAKIGGNEVYINMKESCAILEETYNNSDDIIYFSFDDLEELISFYNGVKDKYSQESLQESWDNGSIIKGE